MKRVLTTATACLFTQVALAQSGTIKQIIQTYNDNQARFHQTWKGQVLRGTATIREIRADVFGTGAVFFISLEQSSTRLTCSTPNRDVAVALNKGNIVDYEGRIDDVTFGTLSLTNCFFKTQPTKPAHCVELRTEETIMVRPRAAVRVVGEGRLSFY